MNPNNMILLVGKSGSGKSTIAKILSEEYGYKEVLSYTTRPKRYKNEQGHIFIEESEFDLLIDLCAYTKFNGYRYGVTKDLIDNNNVYVIDIDGVKYLKEHYEGNKTFTVVAVKCPLFKRIHRMRKRGDNWKNIMSRIFNDAKMFKGLNNISDYQIRNVGSVRNQALWINSIDQIKDK